MVVGRTQGLEWFKRFKEGREDTDNVEVICSSKMLAWQPPTRLNGITTQKTTNHRVSVVHENVKLFKLLEELVSD
jgi:hypothetical protein